MRELFIAYLLVTLVKLSRPGGLRAVAAESLAVKHQLLIMKRAQPRAPKLTAWDRLILGVWALFVPPKRLRKLAVILRPSTLLGFHHALVRRKYRLLYSPRKHRRPGPKGPTKQLIDAIVEMKRRNPRLGCRKIAEHISRAFAINKDIVRRILIRHYRPGPSGDGPSWLAVINHAKDSLWSVDQARRSHLSVSCCAALRGAPQRKFSRAICAISWRSSPETRGRQPRQRPRDRYFQSAD